MYFLWFFPIIGLGVQIVTLAFSISDLAQYRSFQGQVFEFTLYNPSTRTQTRSTAYYLPPKVAQDRVPAILVVAIWGIVATVWVVRTFWFYVTIPDDGTDGSAENGVASEGVSGDERPSPHDKRKVRVERFKHSAKTLIIMLCISIALAATAVGLTVSEQSKYNTRIPTMSPCMWQHEPACREIKMTMSAWVNSLPRRMVVSDETAERLKHLQNSLCDNGAILGLTIVNLVTPFVYLYDVILDLRKVTSTQHDTDIGQVESSEVMDRRKLEHIEVSSSESKDDSCTSPEIFDISNGINKASKPTDGNHAKKYFEI